MSSINLKQLFSDLEKVVGVNAVLYQCARYMNEKGLPYMVPPSTWLEETPITQQDNSSEPQAHIRNATVESDRRVRKGWGAPNAPKKIHHTPVSPATLQSVSRTLDFSEEDTLTMRYSPIHYK